MCNVIMMDAYFCFAMDSQFSLQYKLIIEVCYHETDLLR